MINTVTDSQYNAQLTQVCQHALLSLYLDITETNRFVSVEKRNQILNQYLKPKLKDNHYKCLKRELKRLKLLMNDKKTNGEECFLHLINVLKKAKVS